MQNIYKDIINLASSILRLEIIINIPLKPLGQIKIVVKKNLSIAIGEAIKAFNLEIIGGIKGDIKGDIKGGVKKGIKRDVKGGAKGAIKRGGKRGNSYYK